jgi:hypothetical protein
MPAESNQSQLPAKEITALAEQKKDPALDKGRMIVHLFLLSLMNPKVVIEGTRKSPEIKKSRDLISVTSHSKNSKDTTMETDGECPIRCDICHEKCRVPGFEHKGVMHYCGTHSW